MINNVSLDKNLWMRFIVWEESFLEGESWPKSVKNFEESSLQLWHKCTNGAGLYVNTSSAQYHRLGRGGG